MKKQSSSPTRVVILRRKPSGITLLWWCLDHSPTPFYTVCDAIPLPSISNPPFGAQKGFLLALGSYPGKRGHFPFFLSFSLELSEKCNEGVE